MIDDVIEALSGKRYRYRTEVDLHEGLAAALEGAGIWYEREVKVVGGRIDFIVPAIGLGIEVKIKGTPDALRRQIVRYAADERLHQFLVVTTKPLHRVVARPVDDKPVRVLTIGGLSL